MNSFGLVNPHGPRPFLPPKIVQISLFWSYQGPLIGRLMLGEIGMWVIYLAGAGPFGYCRGQYPEGWLVCAVLGVLVPGFPQVCQPVVGP